MLVDARHLADDLREPLSPQLLTGYDGSDFVAPAERGSAGAGSFQTGHATAIAEGARAVRDAERRAREAVETRAGLHAAIAAVDATRLAMVAVVLAVLALAATMAIPLLDGR